MEDKVPLLVDERTDARQSPLGREHIVQVTLARARCVEVMGHG